MMRALPFACIRARGGVAEMKDAADVKRLVDDGAYLRDGSPSYFVWQVFSEAAGARQGLLCACAVADFIGQADGTDVDAHIVDRILDLGCQDAPIAVERPAEPVLAMIMGAATTGTPVYRFTVGDETHTLWVVKRGEALDALHEMLVRVEGARVAETARLAGAIAAARALRDKARADGTYTGREPFNWFTASLFTADALAAGTPQLPAGLILRPMR